MRLKVLDQSFDPFAEITDYQDSLNQGKYGAACHFVGTMRDFNLGDDVNAMELQHYPGMTEKQLQLILDKADKNWQLEGILVVHRVGHILPGDNIVLCAAWSAHRDVAFEACRFLIEELKANAPFWKKEVLSQKNLDNHSNKGKERWVS